MLERDNIVYSLYFHCSPETYHVPRTQARHMTRLRVLIFKDREDSKRTQAPFMERTSTMLLSPQRVETARPCAGMRRLCREPAKSAKTCCGAPGSPPHTPLPQGVSSVPG